VGKPTHYKQKTFKTMHSCNNTDYLVAAHFVEANHPISSLKYTGIEHVALPRRGDNMEILLLQREAFWISYLKH
jgi:hypothetical protein